MHDTSQENDRGFWWLVGGATVLAFVALVVAIVQMKHAQYRSDNTPTAAVYNYFLALRQGDFERAYALLGETSCKPDKAWFIASQEDMTFQPQIDILSEQRSGDHAAVTIAIYYNDGIFGALEETQYVVRVKLTQTEGQWKITQMPDLLWPFPPLDLPAAQCPYGGD